MAAIDHQTCIEFGCSQHFARLGHAFGIIVGKLSASQDDMAIAVANGFHDGHLAILVNAEEVVWPLCCLNGIDGDTQAAIGTVLETNRGG